MLLSAIHRLINSIWNKEELPDRWKEMLLSSIHKLINSIWNKEELHDQWKESVIVQIHKKDDKTDCNNYCEISLLSTSYKILLSPYVEEIILDHQCGFRRNTSTTKMR
jgi:hypothetical protein